MEQRAENRSRLTGRTILLIVLDLLWLFFIFSRSLRNADQSMTESGRILALVRKILPFMTSFLIRKLGHFTEFFILGGLLYLTGRSLREKSPQVFGFFLPALAGLLAAVTDECIQLGVEGRSGEVRDVLIDFSGVLLALLIGSGIRRLQRKRLAHKNPEEGQT